MKNMACHEPIMVTIQCLAYNQKAYIRQCLDGFVMQRTNFRFQAVVHDDASTDGTADIIREYAEKYPDIIKPILETENQYSKHDGSLKRILFANTHGRYIALCEGDDYWTDPQKLQRQVDLMQAHPDCALCYHACVNTFEDGAEGLRFGEQVKPTYTDVELMDYPFHTATVLYKRELVMGNDLYDKATAIGCSAGDEVLYLTASRFGTIRGINRQMSVYRRHPMGISQQMNRAANLWKNFSDWLRMAELFGGNIGRRIRRERLSDHICTAFLCHKPGILLKMLATCVVRTPVTLPYAASNILHSLFRKA